MKIETLVVGPLETNCYLLSIDNHLLIIDPGDDAPKIKEAIKDKIIDGVIVTHHHFDHVGVLFLFSEEQIYDYHNLKEEEVTLGKFTFDVLYTPGHKSDAISLYFKKDKAFFGGDFIFYESIGRTDLETGNLSEMLESLKKVSFIPGDVTIYPGHGMTTTFKHEREANLYFSEIK